MPRRLLFATAVFAVVLLAALAARWTTRAPLVPTVSARMAPLVLTLQFSARVATASRVELGSMSCLPFFFFQGSMSRIET